MPGSLAYEMGAIRVLSSLNEPLEARIDIAESEEMMKGPVIVDLASKIDFMRHRVDRKYYISDLQASIEKDLRGKSSIRVKSNEPMMDQNIDLLVMMLSAEGKSFGKYHFLLPQIRLTSQPPVVAANRLSIPWKKDRLLASKSRVEKKFGPSTVELISKQKMSAKEVSQQKLKKIAGKVDPTPPKSPIENYAGDDSHKVKPASKKHGFFQRKDLRNLPSRKLFARLHGIKKPKLAVASKKQHRINAVPVDKKSLNKKIQVVQSLGGYKSHKDIFNLDFYTVKSGDSLSSIAMKLKKYYPDIKSWKHLMKEIARVNPDAFIGKNINKIKVSAVLKIPEREKEPVIVARVLDLDVEETENYWAGYNSEVEKQVEIPVIKKQINVLNDFADREKIKLIKEDRLVKASVIKTYSYNTISTVKLKKQNDKAFHLQELVAGSIL